MPSLKPNITARIADRPLYPMLRPFAGGYFIATLGCDLLYFSTQSSAQRGLSVVEFGEITVWLLGAGLVLAVLAGIAALIDFCGEVLFRELPDVGLYMSGSLLVIVLGLYNFLIRYTEGGEDIMEVGLTLSMTTAVVLICTPSRAWNRLYP